MRNNEWVGKRAAMRQNCQMRAEMRFLDGRPPLECIIVDISASGCRIELGSEDQVPEDFDLFIPSRSETKIAKARRQDGVRLGVAFLKSRLDDPLVMQTLLERVGRLERGYSEIKGLVPYPESADRRDGNERPAEVAAVLEAASQHSEPLVEHRLKALAEGLRELRLTVDGLARSPLGANLDGIVERTAESAMELATLKVEMAALTKAMRSLAVGPHAEAANYAADIVDMKTEMSKLSVAMRNMAGDMPKYGPSGANGKAMADASGADTMQLARMKADIAQLRAAVETQQGGAARPVALAPLEEFIAVRAELADLRKTMESSRLAAIDELSAAPFKTRDNPVALTKELVSEVAGLKSDMSTRSEAMRQITGKAYDEAPNFSADLAHMKAEMLNLSIAMREMSAAMPKVQAIAQLDLDPAQIAGIKAEIAQLRAMIDELGTAPVGVFDAPLVLTKELVSEVAGLKSDMSTLSEAMRQITGKAYDEAPNFSADLAHMKAEMLTLSVAMREMSAEMPKVQAIAQRVAPADFDQKFSDLRTDVNVLRDGMWAAMSSAPAVYTKEIADLRHNVLELRESLRTSSSSPRFASEDEFAALRQSVRALILLVSQSLNPSRHAA